MEGADSSFNLHTSACSGGAWAISNSAGAYLNNVSPGNLLGGVVAWGVFDASTSCWVAEAAAACPGLDGSNADAALQKLRSAADSSYLTLVLNVERTMLLYAAQQPALCWRVPRPPVPRWVWCGAGLHVRCAPLSASECWQFVLLPPTICSAPQPLPAGRHRCAGHRRPSVRRRQPSRQRARRRPSAHRRHAGECAADVEAGACRLEKSGQAQRLQR